MVDIRVAKVDGGHLSLANEISENYPPVTDGLRDYFPFDGSVNSVQGTSSVYSANEHYDYNNGFAHDDTSTNLWAPISANYGWQTNYAGTITILPDTPYPRGLRLYKPPEASAHATQGHWHGTWGTTLLSLTLNTVYCISCWYRRASPTSNNINMTVLDNAWGTPTYTTLASYLPSPTYEWQRGYRVIQMGVDATARPYIETNYGRDQTIDVCGMQLEVMRYPTQFTESTRNNAETRYTLNPTLSGMSFAFNYSSAYSYSQINWNGQWTSPMIFHWGDYYANASFSLWTIGRNIYFYCKGNTGSGWQIAGQLIKTLNATFWDNKTHHYVVVFYSSDGTGWDSYAVYIDNVKVGPYAINPKVTSVANNWYGTLDPRYGGMYKNLAVYDKSLNDDEINRLYNWSMQIKSTGLNVKNLKEGAITDSTISVLREYPLACDVDAKYGSYPATTATGIVFEDGACYVGKATTNLGADFKNWGSQRTSTRVMTPDGLGLKFISGSMSSTWSGNSYYYSLKNITATAGQKYTFSSMVYVSEDFDGDWVRICGEAQISADIYYDLTKKGTWQRLSHTYTVAADGTARFLCYASKNGVTNGAFNGYFIFSDPQVELEAYRTPHVDPSRTASDIQVATRDVNLSVSSNFTVYGWFKVADRHLSTYNPILTKDDGGINRLLIMVETDANNDNLVAWFGDGTNATSISFGGTVEINKWIFFAFRRSGEQILLSIYKDGVMYSNSNNLGSYLNAQTNTNPWRFGRWGSQYLDGWIRNFVFVQSALTDQQILNLAKGTMRLTKNGLEVEDLIEEAF